MRQFATVAAFASLCFMACGAPPQPTVARRVSGQLSSGRFVPPYNYEWVVRAERSMFMGQFNEAVVGFVRAQSGVDPDAWLIARMAHAQVCAGRGDDALETLHDGLERFANDPMLIEEQHFVRKSIADTASRSPEAQQVFEDGCRRRFTSEKSEPLRGSQ